MVLGSPTPYDKILCHVSLLQRFVFPSTNVQMGNNHGLALDKSLVGQY